MNIYGNPFVKLLISQPKPVVALLWAAPGRGRPAATTSEIESVVSALRLHGIASGFLKLLCGLPNVAAGCPNGFENTIMGLPVKEIKEYLKNLK